MRPVIHASPSIPDSGWVDMAHLLPAGLAKSSSNGRCLLRRRGDRVMVDLNLTVSATGITTMLVIPWGFRPDAALLTPFTAWIAPQQNSGLPGVEIVGYVGAGGSQIRAGSALPTGTVMVWLDLFAPGPMP